MMIAAENTTYTAKVDKSATASDNNKTMYQSYGWTFSTGEDVMNHVLAEDEKCAGAVEVKIRRLDDFIQTEVGLDAGSGLPVGYFETLPLLPKLPGGSVTYEGNAIQ